MHRALAGFCLLAGLAAVGCGAGSEGSLSGGAGTTQVREFSQAVVAKLYLGSQVPNAVVQLEDRSGEVLASGATGGSGYVVFRDLIVPESFRAVAHLQGSSLEFCAEVSGFHQNNKQARITVVTTLVSRYWRSHPGLSLQQAESQVKRLLNIPNQVDVAIGLSEPNPFFSELAFWRAAAAQGGFEALCARVLAGEGGSFRLSRDQLLQPIVGLEAGLDSVAETGRKGLRHRLGLDQAAPAAFGYGPAISLIEGPSGLGGQFLLGISTGLAGNLITDGVSAFFGWAANQLGLNYGTGAQLQEIENELAGITSLLEGLVTQAQDQNLKNQLQTLNGYLVPVQSANSQLQTSLAAANISNEPFSPPPSFATLIGALNTPNYSTTLTNVQNGLVGPSQAIMTAQSLSMTQGIGVDRPDSMQNFPWRSSQVLDSIVNVYSYFAGQQTLALNLYAEQAHNSAVNPDPVVGVANLMPDYRKATAALKTQRQQLPLYSSQWGTIIDYENGVMWLDTMQNRDTYANATSYAESESFQVVLPDGSTATYDDWRLPTYGEMVSLQNRGKYNPHYDPTVKVNSKNPYPDTGQATAGLPGLGFQQVAEAQVNTDGDLWGSFYELVQNYGVASIQDHANTVFLLNHLSDNTDTQNSSDHNAYLLCRTFGPNPLVDPYYKFEVNPSGPVLQPVPVPPGVEGKPLSAGETAAYGVPTAMALSTTAAPTTVTVPSLNSSANATVNVTVPAQSVQAVANITYEVTVGGNFTTGYQTTAAFSNPAFTYTGNVTTAGAGNQLAELVAWGSSNPALLEVFNTPYLSGIGIPYASNPVNVTASLLGAGGKPVNASLAFTPAAASPHTLQSLQISPRNQIYGASSSQPATGSYPYYCSGFYTDARLVSQASNVTWSVNPASNGANARIILTGAGATLQMNQPGQTTPVPYNLTINAALGGKTDSTTIQIVPPLPINPNTQPTVTSINPTTGPAAGNFDLVIRGLRLGGTTLVRVDSIQASFVVNTGSELTLRMPAGTSGRVSEIRVTTPAGDATANFQYN